MDKDGESETAAIRTKPAKPKVTDSQPSKPHQISAAAAVRREKRLKWWTTNIQKRLDVDDPNKPGDTLPAEKTAATSDNRAEAKFARAPRRFKKRKQGEDEDDDDGKSGETKGKAGKRYAVFVGQIPFDAKEAEVRALFDNIAKPGVLKSFRWRTNPKTNKFAGFAFVEFHNKGAYRRAFELHQTVVSGRPINVEATSAGGRKSKFRKDAIKKETENRQKQAKEALEKKAKDAAKRKKPLPNETPKPQVDNSEDKMDLPQKRKLEKNDADTKDAANSSLNSPRKKKQKINSAVPDEAKEEPQSEGLANQTGTGISEVKNDKLGKSIGGKNDRRPNFAGKFGGDRKFSRDQGRPHHGFDRSNMRREMQNGPVNSGQSQPRVHIKFE